MKILCAKYSQSIAIRLYTSKGKNVYSNNHALSVVKFYVYYNVVQMVLNIANCMYIYSIHTEVFLVYSEQEK